VRRLRKQFKIKALYPKPDLSKANKEHKKYPYLLEDISINRPNQVWSTDITFIRIKGKGWVYLVAIIDYYSRYIVAHEVSITLEVEFCISALQEALLEKKPEIFNSDQGSQFTSLEFTGVLSDQDIKISMTGKGRCLDNVLIERFWRSLKYEEVFLAEYLTVQEAKKKIAEYINFYNHERIHQSLDYYTPHEIYYGIEKLSAG